MKNITSDTTVVSSREKAVGDTVILTELKRFKVFCGAIRRALLRE
jgi:hypothetical protein